MQKIGAAGQETENCAGFMLDPRMERAIVELVRFAAGVGVGSDDLIDMLDAGMDMSEILGMLEEKSEQRVH
jgi:hypothetical protein